MPSQPARTLITGANGHLGRQIISHFAITSGASGGLQEHVRALVRSQTAAGVLQELRPQRRPEIVICDYADAAALTEAAAGCRHVVHLVGIIKETRGASYSSAHERACEALVRAAAAAGVERIVYLSIVGATPDSRNQCLASKGRAEQILLAGPVPVTVLRVPMVIGPDDFASHALRQAACSRIVPLVSGGSTMQQPIDSRDVILAILAALEDSTAERLVLDIGGPERLTHRALVRRAAELHGGNPLVLPVPAALARGFARLAARLLGNPPVTPSMLEVLQQDDCVDEAESCAQLGIVLTPLDETLRCYIGPVDART